MFFRDLTSADSMPALQAAMQFAARRQEVLAHNIANLGTPNFQPLDASPTDFQRTLADAIDRRRSAAGGTHGALQIKRNNTVAQGADGSIVLFPQRVGQGLLRHDRNNSDIDLSMQNLAENTAYFRLSAELLKSRVRLLNTAISERVT